MTLRLFFVYGTLRPDSQTIMAKRLQAEAQSRGPAQTRATLFDCGDYPGLFPGLPTDIWVSGYLYELPDALPAPEYDPTIADPWAWLDAYEGCSILDAEPHEFYRTTIEVRTEDGGVVTAQAYLLRLKPTKARLIKNGDFLHPVYLTSKNTADG